MLFNSIEFAIFLPIVFFLYWGLTSRNLKLQNSLLALVSLFFYGWWDWRFLFLLLFTALVDYAVSMKLLSEEDKKVRKKWLLISIISNLGVLGFFKYFNFFVNSFADAYTFFGNRPEVSTLSIILPVGISFYTFQSLSYTIDVYRRDLAPKRDIISFMAFVSFFPQLVAGPIERATNMLPQFYKKREFDYDKAVDGTRQMLWGFFKKVVIADNCAPYVNDIFKHSSDYSGSTLAVGVLLFTFQIYCDFSGYSDIAIGSAKLFGFTLMRNFAYPYFSRDIAEFWRRWHISLSTWFRDYVYIPLGGSKGGLWHKVRNTFAIFLLSGLWHGASWTYVSWGLINAIYFLPLLLLKRNRANINIIAEGKYLPSISEAGAVLYTFAITCFAWIFFRADSIGQAFHIIGKIFSPSLLAPLNVSGVSYIFIFILLTLIIEWIHRDKQYGLQFDMESKPYIRYASYVFIAFAIVFLQGKQQDFIYFQF